MEMNQEEIEKIVEKYMPLVGRIVAEHEKRGLIDREDLLQAGRLGIIRAIKTFDPDAGAFPSYAEQWIRHYIKEAIEKDHAIRMPNSALVRSGPIERVHDVEDMSLLDITADSYDVVANISADEIVNLIEYIVEGLPGVTGLCFRMHYFENRSLREISKLINKSHDTVRRYILEAKKIIKEILENMDLGY